MPFCPHPSLITQQAEWIPHVPTRCQPLSTLQAYLAGSLVPIPSLLCLSLKHAKLSSISQPSVMLLARLKRPSSFSMGLTPHPSGLSFNDTFSGRPPWNLQARFVSPFCKLQVPCDFSSHHFLQLVFQSYLCSFLFNFSLTHSILSAMRDPILKIYPQKIVPGT